MTAVGREKWSVFHGQPLLSRAVPVVKREKGNTEQCWKIRINETVLGDVGLGAKVKSNG